MKSKQSIPSSSTSSFSFFRSRAEHKAENHRTLTVVGDEDSTLIFLIVRVSTELIRDPSNKKIVGNSLHYSIRSAGTWYQIHSSRHETAMTIARLGDSPLSISQASALAVSPKGGVTQSH